MNDKFLSSLRSLGYADLRDKQETKMREFEKNFNTEFGTEYYFMVMKRDKE